MQQHPPPSSTSCTPSPQTIFRRLGRLLVRCCVSPSTGSNRKSRPRLSLYYYFFVALFDPPKWRANVLPHTFHPVASPLQHPIHHRHHRSVGCCVPSSNGSRPRPLLRPFLNFSMGAIGAPQSTYSAAASPSPGVRRLHKTNRKPRRLDSGPWQMIQWRGRAKALGVGWCNS